MMRESFICGRIASFPLRPGTVTATGQKPGVRWSLYLLPLGLLLAWLPAPLMDTWATAPTIMTTIPTITPTLTITMRVGLALFLGVAFLAAMPVQALERGAQNEKLIKELNLTPEKAKEFQAVGEKYARSRKDLVERIKKNESELEQALAAAKPDEGKIKVLAAAISADHSKLFETFKAQRQEELHLLPPLQQGKIILALKRWHEEMCKQQEKPEKK